MAFEFEAPNLKHKNIIFICSTNFHLIKNNATKETIMNIAEYGITNITSNGYNVWIAISETVSLQQAVDKYDYAVVYTPDTEFEGGKFFEHLHELIKKDFFIAGHVLDRKEGYYELHEQCYVVNLNKYKELECPDVGEAEPDAEHMDNEPIRSDENFHDDYTPLWVKPGDTPKKYTHKWHGWNLVRTALDNGENIIVFDEDIRHSKRCYYAPHETDFMENSKHIYHKYNLSASRLFYPINTEEVLDVPMKGPISQLIMPASGFNWVSYLDKYGIQDEKNTEVIFYDYNPTALYYMQQTIENFEGGDYHKFLKSVNKHKTNDWIDSKMDIADYMSKVKNFNRYKDEVKFKFVECDLLNDFHLKLKNDPNTIFHVSNIFAYEPTAPFIGTKHRVYKENQLIKYLNEKYEKINLIVSVHAWDGFVEYPIHSGPISKFTECDIEDLRAPLWRFGKEWKKETDIDDGQQ